MSSSSSSVVGGANPQTLVLQALSGNVRARQARSCRVLARRRTKLLIPTSLHHLHIQSPDTRLIQHQAVTMSSPVSRRSNRNSVNGTPRRSDRNSEAPPSSDPILPDADMADEQLQSEDRQASQTGSAQNTPRGTTRSSQQTSQSQAPPTSSPLFFRSSPAASQSQSQSQSLNVPNGNGVNVSSPLRHQSAANSSAGGRTPRASGGGIGGTIRVCDEL